MFLFIEHCGDHCRAGTCRIESVIIGVRLRENEMDTI